LTSRPVGAPLRHLSPPTLTAAEQHQILHATAINHRHHLIYSFALGTGLRLAEIVGLNLGDVFAADGTPRGRGISCEVGSVDDEIDARPVPYYAATPPRCLRLALREQFCSVSLL
jgi:hypothetical protein